MFRRQIDNATLSLSTPTTAALNCRHHLPEDSDRHQQEGHSPGHGWRAQLWWLSGQYQYRRCHRREQRSRCGLGRGIPGVRDRHRSNRFQPDPNGQCGWHHRLLPGHFAPAAGRRTLVDQQDCRLVLLHGPTAASQDQDPNNVAVYVNKQQVPQDPNNGWTYGATSQDIELKGSYCDNITAGQDTTVQILFGCACRPSRSRPLFRSRVASPSPGVRAPAVRPR